MIHSSLVESCERTRKSN